MGEKGDLIYEDLTFRVRKSVFSVYNALGPGLREETYKQALILDFQHENIPFVPEKLFPVYFRDKIVDEYRVDLIVFDKLILELKAVTELHPRFEAQLLSYLKIGKSIPKTSLSYLCRGVVLNNAQQKRINDVMLESLVENRKKALVANKKIQESIQEVIYKKNSNFAKLSNREAKLALAFLYLGEGSKRRSFRGLALGSSDPNILKTYMCLLSRCYGIKPNEFKARVMYRADQDLSTLEDYWVKVTKIPKENFYKTMFDPRTIGKPTLRTSYKGVCVLTCRGTHIQLELQAIADIIGGNTGM